MADEERTSETKEIPRNLTPETVDEVEASPTKEITTEKDATAEGNAPEHRGSSSREEVAGPPAVDRTDDGDRSLPQEDGSGEVLREVIQERVEQEEKTEVQNTQETVTEEVGHRETNVVSTEAVDNEETRDVKPSQPWAQQQSAERSTEAAVQKQAEYEEGVEQHEPLPEYLPDEAALDNADEINQQLEEKSANLENSAQDRVDEPSAREKSPQVAEVVTKRPVESQLLAGTTSGVVGRSPVPFEKSPLRSGSLGRADREDTPGEKRVKLSTGEIRIPNLKAQLNNIIKDIEDNVEAPPQEEAHEEIGEDGQVYHTWKPKGTYDFEQTPVVRQEVVPIAVDDVPEPPPVEEAAPPQEGDESGQQGGEFEVDGSGTIRIQPMLPNGTPASPIEIPEGIPLLARILPKEDDSSRERIPLERLFTPATDSGDITPRKKKAFASSDFYAPDHPTIDDQLQLAQKISGSLVDQTNKTSRGQAMYEKRKQRSEKWIHSETDDGQLVQQRVQEEFQAQSSENFSVNDSTPKLKPAMKLVMNPKGVQDHTTVEQHYEQLLQESSSSSSGALPSHIGTSVHIPASPEIAKDIINDMQSPTGKGAALFAKRKKRMDKFIVDETNVQRSSAYQQQSVVNSSFEQSFTNQVSSFSSSSAGAPPQPAAPAVTAPPGSKKRLQQERDLEQQKIMSEFLNKRESQFQLVKSPWEAALEGNTASAFKQNTSISKMSSSFSSSSTVGQSGTAPAWLDGPKPVPISAPPSKPGGTSLPNPPSPFARPAANETKAPATGLVYSAEVKLEQPSKSSLFMQSAASPASPAFKAAAPAPAVPAFTPAAATPAFVPGVSSGSPAPSFGNQNAGFAPAAGPGNVGIGLAAANPAVAAQFTPRAIIGTLESQSLADKRKSANFNLAASGWGTYNAYYRPTSFAS